MRYLRLGTVLLLIVMLVLNGWAGYQELHRDKVLPEIHDSIGPLYISVHDDPSAMLQGLTATDDRDGDLTDKILVERVSRFQQIGQVQVSYVVFDKAGNMGTYSRDVYYDDYTAPRLHLEKPLMYNQGETVAIGDRLKLIDCLEGDITHKLKLEHSNVDDSQTGLYEVTLSATTEHGDFIRVRVPLNVRQYDSLAPVIELSQYLVYTKVGQTVDPLDYITELHDCNGFPIDVNLVFSFPQVDTSRPGGGQIRLEVLDGYGRKGYNYLTVIVEE